MSDVKMHGTVDSSWELLDDTMEDTNTCNGQAGEIGKATAALNLALDQRSVSRAKQDAVCTHDTRNNAPVMPEWPVASVAHTYPSMSRDDKAIPPNEEYANAISARPARSTNSQKSKRVRFKDDEAGMHRTRRQHVAEPVGARATRCLRGIGYDLKHWTNVDPGDQNNKLRYILTRDDRTPISIGLIIIIVVFIFVLISLLCCTNRKSYKSSIGTDPYLAAQLVQMDPAQQARFHMLMNSR